MPANDWVIATVGQALFERLAKELTGAELHSVLLEVMRQRAAARAPSEALAQYQRDGFCRPAAVDQRTAMEVDRHLLGAASDFEAIELSPVAPLGTCSTVAPTDQNRVLSALRGTELVSDPTNVLALECASRLRGRGGGASVVRLATSQRVVRAQPHPKLPGYAPHFRIFVLATGGREEKDHAFTVGALVHHARTMLAALDRLEQHGFSFGARRVEVLARPDRATLGDRVAAAIETVPVTRKPLEHAYYSGGLRTVLWVTAPDGAEVPLVDGGAFDWLAKLASDRRGVYVASGLGAQLVAVRFRVASS